MHESIAVSGLDGVKWEAEENSMLWLKDGLKCYSTSTIHWKMSYKLNTFISSVHRKIGQWGEQTDNLLFAAEARKRSLEVFVGCPSSRVVLIIRHNKLVTICLLNTVFKNILGMFAMEEVLRNWRKRGCYVTVVGKLFSAWQNSYAIRLYVYHGFEF